jgi:hypothetical protein
MTVRRCAHGSRNWCRSTRVIAVDTPIVVALVTGAFGVLVALIQQSRKENKRDHGVVAESLRLVHREVHRVGEKVDRHIEWHAEGGDGDGSSRRN